MKIITILFLMLSFGFSWSENNTITQANGLVENLKYQTAFQLLNEADPDNEDPDIVLLKVDIALNYFVTSIMHKAFSFIDLKPGENIFDYRGQKGTFETYSLPIDDILNKLISKHRSDYRFYNALAKYYYEISLKYGDKWDKSSDELYNLMTNNAKKAIDNKAGDHLSYYIIGFVKLLNKKYSESIPYFLKSLKLKQDEPSTNYNLAYAYLNKNDWNNALKYAKASIGLYTDKTYKGDAARMVATTYGEIDETDSCISYYEKSNLIDPGNYYTLKPLLNAHVFKNINTRVNTLDLFFNIDPSNPTIHNDLFEIYSNAQKESELISYYKSKLSTYDKADTVLGNIYFYIGRLYMQTDTKESKKYFLEAKNVFSKIFDKNHDIFSVIDTAIKELK